MQNTQTVLELIGNTPMIRAQHLDTGHCELYLKLENQNPSGSIKDRIALSMVEAAEHAGKLKPGDTLVEATAGNTGLALALIASQKGYKLTLVIPDKMSQEKIFHARAMGADVVLARSDVTKAHPEYYQNVAARIAEETGGFYVNQFSNPDNPVAHEQTTAPEIWEQMDHRLDAVICGVGSGGTLSGIGRFFKNHAPDVDIILADPEGSILAPLVNEGKEVEPGSWLVEGIGEDFIPDVCELDFTHKAYAISDAESVATARLLLQKEGIICGSSTGTLLAAALKYCREQTEPKRVVTFVCDSGNKYLSKLYNDYWLDDHGFVVREPQGDLRDLISRPHSLKSSVLARPDDTLQAVYRKMKMYDVSQLPVMDESEKLLGIVNETDILLAITASEKRRFDIPVREAMTRELVTVQYTQPLEDLLPVFRKDLVAIIMDGGHFLGLITPIDLLQHLRKKAFLA